MERYPRRTRDTKRIESVLGRHFQSVDAYRSNNVSIRVRVIDPSFKVLSRAEREDVVVPLLKNLPQELVEDITVLLLFAPDELERSSANLDFEETSHAKA